jgi:gamma-glutamyltranspeptidase
LLLSTCMTAHANQGIVVSEQRVASQVGADILRAGGNAIDAAVAVKGPRACFR